MRHQLCRLRTQLFPKASNTEHYPMADMYMYLYKCYIIVSFLSSLYHLYYSTEGLMSPNMDSLVLDRVTIHSDGDQVNITCHFRNTSSPSEGCVVVSRKTNESVLMVEYFSMSTDFPVKLSLSESGNYSVAVFGWSEGRIESFPADVQQVDIMQGSLVLFLRTAYTAGITMPCKSVC